MGGDYLHLTNGDSPRDQHRNWCVVGTQMYDECMARKKLAWPEITEIWDENLNLWGSGGKGARHMYYGGGGRVKNSKTLNNFS